LYFGRLVKKFLSRFRQSLYLSWSAVAGRETEAEASKHKIFSSLSRIKSVIRADSAPVTLINMYRVYHTQGLVLRGAASGEANKTLAIFTRDLGLVHAHAQGIRFEKSKLRYVLRPYSLARINLVRGKGGWRVVSASCEDALEVLGRDQGAQQRLRAIASICEFLERLLHGEEKDPELFSDVHAGIDALTNGAYSTSETRTIKLMVMARALKRLGYWKESVELEAFVDQGDFSAESLRGFAPLLPRAAKAIEVSLAASQL
jgi:hypothetical protein